MVGRIGKVRGGYREGRKDTEIVQGGYQESTGRVGR